ncbi:hypothetical protein I4U23_010986 [Adineta vaga]|nr:hypothetical protein I4U23_010986 [Adineta vaga]
MDDFLKQFLSTKTTIDQLQRMKDDIEQKLRLSNGGSNFADQYKILKDIVDYMHQKQHVVINPVAASGVTNVEYTSASSDNIIENRVSNETVENVKTFIRRKLSLTDDAIIPNVIVIESLTDENTTHCHVIPDMFMVDYYADNNTKITIVQPSFQRD